jgi:hypothetical protein
MLKPIFEFRSLKLEMAVTPDALNSHDDGFNCTFLAPIFAGCSYLEVSDICLLRYSPHLEGWHCCNRSKISYPLDTDSLDEVPSARSTHC